MPLLLMLLVVGGILIKSVPVTQRSHFHVVEYVFIALAYSTFIIAMVEAASSGWLSLKVIGLLLVSFLNVMLFVKRSASVVSPLLQIKVLKNKPFALGLLAIISVQFCVLALGYVIPNYSQIVNHTNALTAGGLLLPGCLVGAFLPLIAGWLLDQLGAFRPIIIGNSLLVISLLLFSYFGVQLQQMMFYGFYVVFTIGQGLCVGNTMTYGLSRLSDDLSADGNALINSMQQLAGAAGTAVAASLVAASQSIGMVDLSKATAVGSQHVFFTLTSILIFAFICTYFMFKSSPQR